MINCLKLDDEVFLKRCLKIQKSIINKLRLDYRCNVRLSGYSPLFLLTSVIGGHTIRKIDNFIEKHYKN